MYDKAKLFHFILPIFLEIITNLVYITAGYINVI